MVMTVGLYATMKTEHMIMRRNPSINMYEHENMHDADTIFDTKLDHYQLAFALTDLMTGKPKNDPRFVRWYASYWKKVESELERRLIPVHTCTDADYANFKAPIKSSQKKFDKLKKDDALQCIDWKSEGLELFGDESSSDYGALDILVVPCNVAWPIPRSRGGTDQGVSDECQWD